MTGAPICDQADGREARGIVADDLFDALHAAPLKRLDEQPPVRPRLARPDGGPRTVPAADCDRCRIDRRHPLHPVQLAQPGS